MLIQYLKNAAIGRCPECAEDKLFSSWSKMKDQCGNCGIWFIEKQGDNWFFLLFVDRGLFIFPIIVGYYFGLRPELLIALCLFLLVLFIVVTPFRLGLCLAFELFLRQKFQKDSQLIHK